MSKYGCVSDMQDNLSETVKHRKFRKINDDSNITINKNVSDINNKLYSIDIHNNSVKFMEIHMMYHIMIQLLKLIIIIEK